MRVCGCPIATRSGGVAGPCDGDGNDSQTTYRPRTRSRPGTIPSLRHAHCTFAVTDALAFNVKVHVLVLLPPLEQAPDQMTSRVLLDDSVIDVPPANDADPVLPTATLMPAGLDEIRSPLRPVAVTVRVNDPDGGGGGGGDDGVTVKVAVLVAPPNAPLIVTGVDALTAVVEIVNVALVAPAGTITLAGAVAKLAFVPVDDPRGPPPGAAPV